MYQVYSSVARQNPYTAAQLATVSRNARLAAGPVATSAASAARKTGRKWVAKALPSYKMVDEVNALLRSRDPYKTLAYAHKLGYTVKVDDYNGVVKLSKQLAANKGRYSATVVKSPEFENMYAEFAWTGPNRAGSWSVHGDPHNKPWFSGPVPPGIRTSWTKKITQFNGFSSFDFDRDRRDYESANRLAGLMAGLAVRRRQRV